jgi:hypothetical protein
MRGRLRADVQAGFTTFARLVMGLRLGAQRGTIQVPASRSWMPRAGFAMA